MHWFMTHTICLDNPSKERFWARHPASNDSKYHRSLVPRKVTTQIRNVLREPIIERTKEVLKELERKLKSREKNLNWAPCFCAVSILCICAEILQIAADTNAVHDMHQEGRAKHISRDTCVKYCQQLDRFPIKEAITNFHGRLRSHQLKDDKQIENGFNPPRDGCEGLKQPDKDLATDIRRIWEDHSEHQF